MLKIDPLKPKLTGNQETRNELKLETAYQIEIGK